MTNKLNPRVVAFSLAGVSAIISLLCALSLIVSPSGAMKLFGSIFHGVDFTQIATPVTASGVMLGLIAIIITALISGWLFAVIYNAFSGKTK